MKLHNKLMAIAILAFICQSTVAFAGGFVKVTDLVGGNGDGHSGGTNIYFGQYWQDGSGTELSGYTKTAIKWRLLANNTTDDGNGNKGLFLLSDKALYADTFQAGASTNQWKDSEIRTTLNNATAGNGFAGDAFSAKELAAINETTHKQGGDYTGKDATSAEKIFLLSAEETAKSDYGFTTDDTRIMAATELAKNVKMYGNSAVSLIGSAAFCWLRSPGNYNYDVYRVNDNGYVYYNYSVIGDGNSACPALNLDSSKILFLSAAEGGKTGCNVGDGFVLADYTGKDYKVTLNNSELSKPTVNLTIKNGKLDGTFSGATTGTNKYLTVYLLDSSGNPLNYAKIADCSTAANGSFSGLDFAAMADGVYTLQFCSEEANGNKLTDYVSEAEEHEIEITAGKVTNIPGSESSSGSGGCNAGFGALALLLTIPFYRRKK